MRDFRNLQYLRDGSAVQREGYRVIEESRVMEILAAFSPVLAGTLPLDLFTTNSDLDILCESNEISLFEETLTAAFARHEDFTCERKAIRGINSIVCQWKHSGFMFEVFGQPVPVDQQYGYRHLLIEWEILNCLDTSFKERIIALKNQGVKTEPAFAEVLGLSGDPYESLLAVDLTSLSCV